MSFQIKKILKKRKKEISPPLYDFELYLSHG